MNKYFLVILILFLGLVFTSCNNAKRSEINDRNQYLEDNNINILPTESGLYYIETATGSGLQAQSGDTVTVNYSGKFLDGSEFDSSYDRGEPIEFVLGIGIVIAGWDEGISYMKEGGKATLIISSDLAYGPKDYYNIPGYSTLVFDVELVKVKKNIK